MIVFAVAGALIVAGLLGVVAEVAGLKVLPRRPARRVVGRPSGWQRLSQRTRRVLAAAIVVGVVLWLVTGWVLAVVLVPAAVVMVPWLMSAPEGAHDIERLEALEEWTRALSGILTAGQGVEQALIASVRSTPEAIRPEITRLAARLRARWATEAALRALADELDDATGDLIAANLMLAARRRSAGVARVLESLAESVGADVRARREIEADRAKPRSTARWVTIATVGLLVYLTLSGDFVAPYGTPLGQVLLALYLSAYVAALVWMKRMARGRPLPRFIGTAVKGGAR